MSKKRTDWNARIEAAETPEELADIMQAFTDLDIAKVQAERAKAVLAEYESDDSEEEDA